MCSSLDMGAYCLVLFSQSTKISCNGSYEDVDVLNVQCIHNLEAVSSVSFESIQYE